jgi:glutamyl-Q tRNA(Asp) synthetase
MSVIGRFAPSPTGPLHFGSVVAAVASYMQAKSRHGKWLVRMDDIDTPRNQAGADTAILKSLEILGLYWDDEVLFQSHRQEAYQEALNLLSEKSLLYRCTCTRKQLQGNAYPGTCRDKAHSFDRQHALRVLSNQEPININDEIQGHFQQILETEIGDFIVHRADGLVAYHIATVVDDAYQNITEIVRGADLLDSTPRQIYLQQLFNYHSPAYAHLPVAVDKQGFKLSKQYHAKPIDDKDPVTTLILALDFLGQNPDKLLAKETVEEIIQWGITHWSLEKIPRRDSIEVESN